MHYNKNDLQQRYSATVCKIVAVDHLCNKFYKCCLKFSAITTIIKNCCIRYIRQHYWTVASGTLGPTNIQLTVKAQIPPQKASCRSLLGIHFSLFASHTLSPSPTCTSPQIYPPTGEFYLAAALVTSDWPLLWRLHQQLWQDYFLSHIWCVLYDLLLLLFFTSRSVHISYEHEKALLVSFDLLLLDVFLECSLLICCVFSVYLLFFFLEFFLTLWFLFVASIVLLPPLVWTSVFHSSCWFN